MPVFERGGRQVLFVHVPRTGGRAIEAYYGLDGSRAAPDRDALLGRELRDDAPYALFGGRGVLLPHLTPAELERFGYLRDVERYLSFCVVRDPLDRVVSSYRSRPRREPFGAWLAGFLDAEDHPHRTPQHAFVYDGRGRQVVREVLRHEVLSRSFLLFARRYGLQAGAEGLGQHDVSRTPAVKPTAAETDMVLDAFHEDFDLFGYRRDALLLRACRRVARDGAVTLGFLAADELPLFDLWWRHARAHPLDDMVVVCHDEASAFHVRARGLTAVTLHCAPDPFTTARERARLVKRLLDQAIDVVHTGFDCLWFRDLRPLLADGDHDWQFGLDPTGPHAAVSAWGFGLDAGFWRCNSNDRTRRAWDRLVGFTERHGDLGAALHDMFVTGRIRWREADTRDGRIVSATGRTRVHDVGVRALPDTLLSRTARRGASVFHPDVGGGTVRERLRKLHAALGGGAEGAAG